MKLLKILLLPMMLIAIDPVLASSEGVAEIGMGSRFVSMLTGLFFIVILIFFSAWLYKKMGGVAHIEGADIQVIARQSLGTREKVVLIRAKGQELLVGVTPSSITTLHVYDKTDGFDDLLRQEAKVDNED